MKYIGNQPGLEIIHSDGDRYDYIATTNPTANVNPSAPFVNWLNSLTGEVFVCTNNVVDNNVWIGAPTKTSNILTYYVDGTFGTDSPLQGSSAGAGAFRTIQYAIDRIPAIYTANIIIYVAAGTYSESVTIRDRLSVAASLQIVGTLSLLETQASATVAAGADATHGTVTKTGQFAGNTYAGKLVYFATNNTYRVIDYNNNDTLYLCGTAPSSTTQDITVYDWGTIVTRMTFRNMLNVSVQNINCHQFEVYTNSGVSASRCCCSGGYGWSISGWSTLTLDYCSFVVGTNYHLLQVLEHSQVVVSQVKFYGGTASKNMMYCSPFARSYIRGSVFEGVSNATGGQTGVDSRNISFIDFWSAVGYTKIQNFTNGIYMVNGGHAVNNAYVSYTLAPKVVSSSTYSYSD